MPAVCTRRVRDEISGGMNMPTFCTWRVGGEIEPCRNLFSDLAFYTDF